MIVLTEEEIADIRRALEFFKQATLKRDDMSLMAAGLYNAAIDAVEKLERQSEK
ncbi:hypothetical protein V5K00_RS04470 [Enterobacter asburiae]